jgi:hypothetical protein
MKQCHARGYLVGANTELPDDERVYQRADQPVVGCNRVLCGVCGAQVRQWRGFRQAEVPRGKAEHAELFTTSDPDVSRYLTRENGGEMFRVYACNCSATEICNAVDLGREFIEFDGWGCGGHPEST